ncbi:unnamed protein product, partial [Rhizoctonia solani]
YDTDPESLTRPYPRPESSLVLKACPPNHYLQHSYSGLIDMRNIGAYIGRRAYKIKRKLTFAVTSSNTSTLTHALRAFQDSARVFPPLQATIGDLIVRVEHIELSSKHRRKFEDLARRITLLSASLAEHMQASKLTHVSYFFERKAASVKDQVTIISKNQERGTGWRFWQAKQYQDEMVKGYEHIAEILEELREWCIEEQQTNSRLEALAPVHDATYDSMMSRELNRRACARDTRANILNELEQWSLDPTKPNIFWLNGTAGMGKTTIAYTFAQSLRERGALGATFFCVRASGECRDARRIIPAVAYQLAQYLFSFRSALLDVLENEHSMKLESIADQCEQLIKEPLSRIKGGMTTWPIIVIDGLDECSSSSEVETMLDMLFRVVPNLPIKVLVTSRPEPNIRRGIVAQSDQSRSICVLREIDDSPVEVEVEQYLHEALGNSVSEHDLSRLSRLSGGWFICAVTLVRYLFRQGNIVDQGRLEAALTLPSDSENRHLDIDRLYTMILDSAVYGPDQEPEDQEQMRLIIWTALRVREPVSVDTLAALTGIEVTKANILLEPLYSILYMSQATGTITTLHASFPDFMFDKARSAKFYCDEAKHNQLLAKRCFQLMQDQLRFNICGIETSFIPDSKVQDLEARVQKSISPTLSYVAKYWGDHLMKSAPCKVVRKGLGNFLSDRLLFWIEVLSLKHILDKGISILSEVKRWMMDQVQDRSSDLIRSLDDSRLFLSKYTAGSVSQSTPHIYISALAFCNRPSSVYERGDVALGPLKGHTDWVRSVAFSPDGLLLVSGSDDKTILVRDAQTGSRIYDAIKGHESGVTSVSFSADGKLILSGSEDKTTRMWDSGNGSLIPNSIKHHPGEVRCTAFSPNSKYIACGLDSYVSPIAVYDAFSSKSLPFPFNAHQSLVYSIAFSPNSKHLVTGHRFGDLRVWSLQDGTATHSPPKVHNSLITSIGFSPLGDKLITTSWDRCMYIWDVENGYSNPHLLGNHDSLVYSTAFSPDSTRVASCSLDRTVKMWNIIYSTSSHTSHSNAPTKSISSVVISPDGSSIAAAASDKAIYMFSAHDGTAILKPFVAHTGLVLSVAFSPDGRYLASGGSDKAICIWDSKGGKLLSGPLRGHKGWVQSVMFSSDGRHIVSASTDKTIRKWDVRGGSLGLTNLVGTHDGWVYSAAFRLDGQRIVSSCSNRKIYIWDAQTVSLVLDPFGSQWFEGGIRAVTFSPDGRFIACGSTDSTIRMFDSRSGDLVLGPLKGHEGPVMSVVFSPDGNHIVSGSDDGGVQVWKAEDGTPACEPLQGHLGWVSSVVCSSDGMHIISGSSDSTIRLWRAPGGRVVSDLSHPNSGVPDRRDVNRAMAGGLAISEDGWVRNRESELLFWVPSDMVKLFPTLETVYTISPEGVLQADYSRTLLLGDEWALCYEG